MHSNLIENYHYYEVLLPLHYSKLYTYKSQQDIRIGTFIYVEARNKTYLALIIKKTQISKYTYSIKNIICITEYQLDIQLIPWIFISHQYTLISAGVILQNILSGFYAYSSIIPGYVFYEDEIMTSAKLISSISLRTFHKYIDQGMIKPVDHIQFHRILLDMNAEQTNAYNMLHSNNKTAVLQGPTGSGKTHVYLQIVMDALSNGRQVLIMLPEIALTQEFAQHISKMLSVEPMVWNHMTDKAIKKSIWHWAISGRPGLLIGARSAIWLPMSNLQYIIIDEEHDASYKQEQQIVYHAVRIALLRAQYQHIKCILVSATPSLESCYNIIINKYQQVRLTKKQNIDVVYAKIDTKHWLSQELYKEIQQTLVNKKQILLFINKRGFATKVLCTSCRQYLMCNQCSSYVIFYKNKYTRCPTCNNCTPLSYCINCYKDNIRTKEWRLYGLGIEKIAQELGNLFPTNNISIVSSDVKNIRSIIKKIHNRTIDIIISTQILSKGYNFQHLAAVGVLQADHFASCDPRHGEKIYQLIEQVKGRCARYNTTGRVIIQSETKNPIIEAILHDNFDEWMHNELQIRRKFEMPPFVRLIKMIVVSKDEKQAKETATSLYYQLSQHKLMTTYPASAAQTFKIATKFRYCIIIKSAHEYNAQNYIDQVLQKFRKPSNCQIIIDVDPYSFA